MTPSHGNPNKTWIIFIPRRMAADFTSQLLGEWERGGKRGKRKERPGQNRSMSPKGQHIQNHQWRPFLLGGKINTQTDPFSFASVWCYRKYYCSYSSQPNLVTSLSCLLSSSLSCGKIKFRCVCTGIELFPIGDDRGWQKNVESCHKSNIVSISVLLLLNKLLLLLGSPVKLSWNYP